MEGKRGVLIVVSLFLLVLLGGSVKAALPLNMTTIGAMTGSDFSGEPSGCSNNWRVAVNADNSEEGDAAHYFGYFRKTLAIGWTSDGTAAYSEQVYLKFYSTSGQCVFPAGWVDLKHDGLTHRVPFPAITVSTSPSFFRVELNGSLYDNRGFCNLTSPSSQYAPTIISVPANWGVFSKESGGAWTFWNGTRNLSNEDVLFNHTSGNYIRISNITTTSTIFYDLSGSLIINDSVIGINETSWQGLKSNLCFETGNITIKTPTQGTYLRKYNVSNGVLLNGSASRSVIPTDIWTIPAALGFSQYVAGYKSALTIYEANDPRYFNQTVFFYANYTNITDGTPVFIGGMNCSIWFSDWGNWTNMTNATSSGVYEFNRTFSRAGLYSWNVTCNESTDSFDWLMAGENITITNYSRADIFFYSPAADSSVSKHSLFNITTGVICRDYHCGNMTAALDPLEVSDQYSFMSSAKEERIVNIVEIKESEVYPPWTMLALLLVGLTAIALLVGLSTLNHHEKTVIFIFLCIAAFGSIIAQQPAMTGYVVYDSASHLVNMTPGATPFFTLNNNTYNLSNYACLNNLQADQGCNVTWQINATGTAGNKYEFFAVFNSTTYGNLTNSTPRVNITINAVCGNSICESGENCTTCSRDCSICVAQTVAGSSFCTPRWECSVWSSCIRGNQTRDCRDANKCQGYYDGEPVLEKECTILQNKFIEKEKNINDSIFKKTITGLASKPIANESPAANLESPLKTEEKDEKALFWFYAAVVASAAILLFTAIFFIMKKRKKKEETTKVKKTEPPPRASFALNMHRRKIRKKHANKAVNKVKNNRKKHNQAVTKT